MHKKKIFLNIRETIGNIFPSVEFGLISARRVGNFLLLCKLQLICEWNPLKQKEKARAKSGGKWCQSRTVASPCCPHLFHFGQLEWFATFCHFRWCKADTRTGRQRGEERSSTLIKIKRFGVQMRFYRRAETTLHFRAIVVCIFILKSHNEVSAKTTGILPAYTPSRRTLQSKINVKTWDASVQSKLSRASLAMGRTPPSAYCCRSL